MSEQRYPVHVAEDFLRANLPANAKDIEARVRAAGIASSTLWRARQRLGVIAGDGWWWLPRHPPPDDAVNNSTDLTPVADLRLCDHCGQPGTADDPVRHGYWRANRPAGNCVHAGCIHPYQAAGRWK